MNFTELAAFDVAHHHLGWPWITIDASHTRFAFPVKNTAIATRVVQDHAVTSGATFTLPGDLALPDAKASDSSHHGASAGVHGFSIDKTGALLAVTGTTRGAAGEGGDAPGVSVLVTLTPEGELRRTTIASLAGADFIAHAVAFDRSGTKLFVSAESGKETAILLVDARSHALLGKALSPAFPPPAAHELHLHAQDDAVLLLAACGQDGTFARVAGFAEGPLVAIPTALDKGSVSAGLVGFSADGARVHLAEADELRTHAWPGLEELSSVDLADDFVSSYAGVVLDHRVLVDGEDMDTGDVDAVMIFEPSALRGVVAKPPVPSGMWVGRVGSDMLVTVEAKGEPARGRLLRLPAPLG